MYRRLTASIICVALAVLSCCAHAKTIGLKGSDPSVYALLYMLDFGAADVVDYAAS